MTSTYGNWIRTEIFNPVNNFIIIFNVIFFLGILLLFFWYILSSQFQNIILDKVEIISLLAQNDTTIKKSVQDYIDTVDINQLKISADSDKIKRTDLNNQLFIEKLLGWFVVLGVVMFICFYLLYLHAINKKMSKGDMILIFLLIFSFVTEIVFYFAVVTPWKFIGDYELINNLSKQTP